MNKKYQKLEKKIKISFDDKEKLHQAFVHRSYLNENGNIKKSNERYEFLGDAVLELWATKTLFSNFPDLDEGRMTNLRANVVRTETLSQTAIEIGLDQYILLSKGEDSAGGTRNFSILADTFEALVGAIYLDQGQHKAYEFLDRFLLSKLKSFGQEKTYKDPKSIFQELSQAKEGITPHYQVIKSDGPDHKKTFTVEK